jgi:hypothetical protein
MLKPRQAVPPLEVATLDGKPWQLDEVLKALDFIKARDYPPRGDA